MYRKIHDRLQSFYASHASDYVYLLALILALPDMLDMLAGVDYSLILPEGWGSKVGVGLTIARATVGVYIRRMPIPVRRQEKPTESPDLDAH